MFESCPECGVRVRCGEKRPGTRHNRCNTEDRKSSAGLENKASMVGR